VRAWALPASCKPASARARRSSAGEPWHVRCCSPAREHFMTDLLIVALTAALFAAAVGFVRLCERM
jgi:hypothetical protein